MKSGRAVMAALPLFTPFCDAERPGCIGRPQSLQTIRRSASTGRDGHGTRTRSLRRRPPVIFRRSPRTCPCPRWSVHSARRPNNGRPPCLRPLHQTEGLWLPISATGRRRGPTGHTSAAWFGGGRLHSGARAESFRSRRAEVVR